jgi:hypothetical protein
MNMNIQERETILLTEAELEAVAGGRPDTSIVVVKFLDSATPQLYLSAPAK